VLDRFGAEVGNEVEQIDDAFGILWAPCPMGMPARSVAPATPPSVPGYRKPNQLPSTVSSPFFEDTAVRRLHIIKRTAPSLFQWFAHRITIGA
jgi:hypothetical protein